MIPHPNAINDPKHFLGDLETLLRRYGVTIDIAGVMSPKHGVVVVGGFRAARWMVAFDQSTTDHKSVRRMIETAENMEASERDRQVKL